MIGTTLGVIKVPKGAVFIRKTTFFIPSLFYLLHIIVIIIQNYVSVRIAMLSSVL